jgi:two-component system cell cycle response regulator
MDRPFGQKKMGAHQTRVLLVDVSDESREVLVRRLGAQGYSVETASDPATGADMALSAPPAVLIADLWMPSISGVQLCRLLRAEPATADVPVILRGPTDDPRSCFWAERAGAAAYVVKGRMGELVRALAKAVEGAPTSDGFFMQLGGGGDVRDRIARHLDAALFESVIAGEVRALASSGSFEQLFDSLSQLLSRLIGYRWVALRTTTPAQLAVHHHPRSEGIAEAEVRALLGMGSDPPALRVVDEDAHDDATGAEPIIREIPFGGTDIGVLALAPLPSCEADTAALVSLVARELGGAVRMTALMDESQRLATVDPLTGLLNRRAFMSMLVVEVDRCRRYHLPLSFLLLDIDHFKSVNDTYGHSTGDRLLMQIGAHLQSVLRTPDSAARWGGEEFVVALKNTDLGGGAVVADRLCRSISELRIPTDSGVLSVTASIGVSSLQEGQTMEALIESADQAMYAAKTAGRNRMAVSQHEVAAVSDDARVRTA